MFPVMKNGKELYCPKGRRGSKGEPAVPPSPGIYYASAMCLFAGVNTVGGLANLGVGTSSTTPEYYSGNQGYYMRTAISGVLTATSANTNIYLLLKVEGSYPSGTTESLAISSNNQLFRVVRVA